MHAEQARLVAQLLGAETIKGPDGSGYITLNCPFAPWKHQSGRDRNPSMRLKTINGGVSRFHCFSCGAGGDLAEIISDLQVHGMEGVDWLQLLALANVEEEDLVFPDLRDTKVVPKDLRFPEHWLGSFPHSWAATPSREYLTSRGVDLQLQARYDLRWDASRQRVAAPVRDFDGILRGMQGRTLSPVSPSNPKYMHYRYQGHASRQFWFNEVNVDLDEPVILCEGAYDAIRIGQAYDNVLAVMGAASVMTYDKLDRITPAMFVVTMFDPNQAGDQARERVSHWCENRRKCRHLVVEDYEDPGAAPVDYLRELITDLLDNEAW